MKGIWVGLHSFLLVLGTVAVALAEEAKAAEDPYQAMYYIWYALIGIILVWGVYDSFFRPLE